MYGDEDIEMSTLRWIVLHCKIQNRILKVRRFFMIFFRTMNAKIKLLSVIFIILKISVKCTNLGFHSICLLEHDTMARVIFFEERWRHLCRCTLGGGGSC